VQDSRPAGAGLGTPALKYLITDKSVQKLLGQNWDLPSELTNWKLSHAKSTPQKQQWQRSMT